MQAVRIVILIARVVVGAAFLFCIAVSPLVWNLRDGMGPDSVETSGAAAWSKFLIGWGAPAFVLAALFLALTITGFGQDGRYSGRRPAKEEAKPVKGKANGKASE